MTTTQSQAELAAFRDADAVLRAPLPSQISMAPVVSGTPVAYEDVIADTGFEFFAIWSCDAGVFPRVKDRRGSFMYLLAGAGQIVSQDGTSHELAGDSILILPYGWRGHWNITQTVRKVYVHTTPVPPFRDGVQPSVFAPAASLRSGDQVVFDGPDGVCRVQTTEPGAHPQVASARSRFSYVISGSAAVVDAAGVSTEVAAGSALTLPAGWSGTWHVRTALRTFDVLSSRPGTGA